VRWPPPQESDGEESEWEDAPVELKPAKLRARRNKVNYAEEADEADEEGAEKAAPAASGAQEAEEEEGKEEEDSATEDNDDDDGGSGGGATRQRGGTAGGDTAAGGRAEWRVMLGGRFQPYEPRVQKVIEAAYARRHLVDEVRRGRAEALSEMPAPPGGGEASTHSPSGGL